MKIGVISDIHGNILALETVFKEFEKMNIDKVICVGDVIGIGPYPEKCIDFLMNKNNIISFVRGNHENYLIKGLPKTNHNIENGEVLNEEEINFHKSNHNRLNAKQIKYIHELKNRDDFVFDNKRIIVEHYPMDKNDKFKKYYDVPTQEKIMELFDNKEADIYLFGHTHKKVSYLENNKLYVNPGSLGCPKGTNGASVGIITIENDNINYENMIIEYDVDSVIEDIKSIKFPLYKFIIKRFYK